MSACLDRSATVYGKPRERLGRKSAGVEYYAMIMAWALKRIIGHLLVDQNKMSFRIDLSD